MKVCGIIAEFNPFHKGHEYLIKQVRKQYNPDVIVAVMSGNYVQRGEPAIIDKWQRTETALNNGVDLVVELPFSFAVEPASIFATGAIEILGNLGINCLAFGTEEVDFDYRNSGQILTQVRDNNEFTDNNRTYSEQLRDALLNQLDIDLIQPNQLLGMEYAAAINQSDFKMDLLPIQRIGAGHDEMTTDGKLSSASQIRENVLERKFDDSSKIDFEQINQKQILSWDRFYKYLKYRILTSSTEELSDIYQMTEGLEYRIKKNIKQANNFKNYLNSIKSNRYTYARLRRLSLYTLLDVRVDEMQISYENNHIHVLGFNQSGQEQLSNIKSTTQLPIITKVTKEIGAEKGIMSLDIKADNVIEMLTQTNQNFNKKPIIY